MPVAEEVHFLYPEGAWALERVQDDPAHLYFKAYGEQVPDEDWNEDGTKQGIYMMGPNGEYLEGLHAASGSADRLVRRLERALERWSELRDQAGYAAEPVPVGDALAPPEVTAAPLALRVSLRDLPRTTGDDTGRRITDRDRSGRPWMAFTEWAWNQNWLTLDDPRALVPVEGEAEREVPVPRGTVERIVRHALVDNVRGQNPAWPAEGIRYAELAMTVVAEEGELWTIAYRGAARLETQGQRFAPTLVGRATWHREDERFTAFQLVAVGERAGAARFNQRDRDPGPAPMGVVLDLFVPPAPSEADAAD